MGDYIAGGRCSDHYFFASDIKNEQIQNQVAALFPNKPLEEIYAERPIDQFHFASFLLCGFFVTLS